MSKLICLDPGHAKNTPGKRAGNPTFYEYAGNRRVARKAKELLEKAGFKVMYSCNLNDPNDLSLAQRAANARNAEANLFISIHTNAINNTSVRGTETFIHTNSQASLAIARAVQKAMLEEIGQRDRGVKRANFGVLRGTYKTMLSILTEADFFTNPTAREWMFQESFDDAYAKAILTGVCNHYGVKIPDDKPPVAPNNSKQNNPPTEDVGAALVRVTASRVNVRNRLSWDDNAIDHQVQRGEAFTVMAEHKVGNSSMYELKSGLFITTSSKYVELDGRVADTRNETSVGNNSSGGSSRQPIRPYPGHTLRLRSPFMRDRNGVTDIQAVQRAVGVKPDGVFGPVTERAVINYQRRHKLTADGIVGPKTWNVMF